MTLILIHSFDIIYNKGGVDMIKIAVVDDEQIIIDETKKFIERFLNSHSLNFKLYTFNDGKDLLLNKEPYDLIFLDIEMKTLDGIDTAIQIRNYDMNVPIVYITSFSKYWRSAYQVHAFGFIEKPIHYEKIANVLNDFIQMCSEKSSGSVTLKTDEGTVVQNTNEIYYFLIDKRKVCTAYTFKRNFVVKENLNAIYEQLDNVQFYRPHRCCIVNLKYVDCILDFDIIMKNGEFVPVAQKRKKDFLEALHNYLHN